MDLKLLQNIMEEVRENTDLLDSLSPMQFKSKLNLINHIKSLNILNKDSEIVIFGSWYGSILIPAFYNDVKRITAIDMDAKVISKSKYKIFKDYDVEFITGDIFEKYRDQYTSCDLFINTSCEHMKPMKEWGPAPKYKNPWWYRCSPAHFAFQSNNMYDIQDHINCVSTIEEFKTQLPDNAKVLIEDKIKDDRGIRFTLIGQL
jgi:hypothetical protein